MSSRTVKIGKRSKKQDGNFGYEKSFRSFVPELQKNGTKRTNSIKIGRIVHAVWDPFCINGRYCQ